MRLVGISVTLRWIFACFTHRFRQRLKVSIDNKRRLVLLVKILELDIRLLAPCFRQHRAGFSNLAAAIFQMCFKLRCGRESMNAVITVSDRQIEVYRKSSTVAVRWASITKIRHVASTQVLHLYDDKGQRFLSITEQLNGYAFLVGLLHEKSGLDV